MANYGTIIKERQLLSAKPKYRPLAYATAVRCMLTVAKLAQTRSAQMQQHAKAVRFVLVGSVATLGAILLVISMFQFVAPKAEATPAIGQGKPCNGCHTSGSPSKNDVKK